MHDWTKYFSVSWNEQQYYPFCLVLLNAPLNFNSAHVIFDHISMARYPSISPSSKNIQHASEEQHVGLERWACEGMNIVGPTIDVHSDIDVRRAMITLPFMKLRIAQIADCFTFTILNKSVFMTRLPALPNTLVGDGEGDGESTQQGQGPKSTKGMSISMKMAQQQQQLQGGPLSVSCFDRHYPHKRTVNLVENVNSKFDLYYRSQNFQDNVDAFKSQQQPQEHQQEEEKTQERSMMVETIDLTSSPPPLPPPCSPPPQELASTPTPSTYPETVNRNTSIDESIPSNTQTPSPYPIRNITAMLAADSESDDDEDNKNDDVDDKVDDDDSSESSVARWKGSEMTNQDIIATIDKLCIDSDIHEEDRDSKFVVSFLEDYFQRKFTKDQLDLITSYLKGDEKVGDEKKGDTATSGYEAGGDEGAVVRGKELSSESATSPMSSVVGSGGGDENDDPDSMETTDAIQTQPLNVIEKVKSPTKILQRKKQTTPEVAGGGRGEDDSPVIRESEDSSQNQNQNQNQSDSAPLETQPVNTVGVNQSQSSASMDIDSLPDDLILQSQAVIDAPEATSTSKKTKTTKDRVNEKSSHNESQSSPSQLDSTPIGTQPQHTMGADDFIEANASDKSSKGNKAVDKPVDGRSESEEIEIQTDSAHLETQPRIEKDKENEPDSASKPDTILPETQAMEECKEVQPDSESRPGSELLDTQPKNDTKQNHADSTSEEIEAENVEGGEGSPVLRTLVNSQRVEPDYEVTKQSQKVVEVASEELFAEGNKKDGIITSLADSAPEATGAENKNVEGGEESPLSQQVETDEAVTQQAQIAIEVASKTIIAEGDEKDGIGTSLADSVPEATATENVEGGEVSSVLRAVGDSQQVETDEGETRPAQTAIEVASKEFIAESNEKDGFGESSTGKEMNDKSAKTKSTIEHEKTSKAASATQSKKRPFSSVGKSSEKVTRKTEPPKAIESKTKSTGPFTFTGREDEEASAPTTKDTIDTNMPPKKKKKIVRKKKKKKQKTFCWDITRSFQDD